MNLKLKLSDILYSIKRFNVLNQWRFKVWSW